MSQTPRFDGHAVIVTGGTKGIGQVIAEAFLGAGADVLVCARNQPEALPTGGGRTATFMACDVRDPDHVEACVSECVAEHGRLDVLVNNAGGAPPAASAEASPRFRCGRRCFSMGISIHLRLVEP